jgi:cytochrome c
MRRLLTAMLLLSCWAGGSPAQEPDKLIEQGKLLAMTFCAQCHAVGMTDASPYEQAPAFRALDRRVDLDTFFQRLREGISVGHPTCRPSASDAMTRAPSLPICDPSSADQRV